MLEMETNDQIENSSNSTKISQYHNLRVKEEEILIQDQVQRFIESCESIRNQIVIEKQLWEEEKLNINKIQIFSQIVHLNVGGATFITSLDTLTRYPDSMLGVMFSGRHAIRKDEAGYVCIDRDGTHFRHILNFLRDPEKFTMSNLSMQHKAELRNEAEFYCLDQVMFPHGEASYAASVNSITCEIVSDAFGYQVTISQDEQSLYWGQLTDYPHLGKVLITVCNGCGSGSFHMVSYLCELPNFSGRGRVISNAQPRRSWNNGSVTCKYCSQCK